MKLSLVFFATTLTLAFGQTVQNYFAILNNAQPVDKPICDSLAHGSAVATYAGGQLCVLMNMNLIEGETLTRLEGPADIGIDGEIKYKLPLGAQKIECISIVDPVDVQDLQDGLMYINVRSIQCPQGEIRGQLMRTS